MNNIDNEMSGFYHVLYIKGSVSVSLFQLTLPVMFHLTSRIFGVKKKRANKSCWMENHFLIIISGHQSTKIN